MLIRNLMMMMRGFKSHSIASLECLCVLVGVVVRGGGLVGLKCLAPDGEHLCVEQINDEINTRTGAHRSPFMPT